MKLSICTDVMGDLSFTDMLDKCVALGVEGIEMTGGGWSPAPHFRAETLLADRAELSRRLGEIEARGLALAGWASGTSRKCRTPPASRARSG